jgi:glycosyltransferase involved in cell wall biosynthesis
VRVVLVGNYVPDRQHSMLSFASLMEEGLKKAGHQVRTLYPPVIFGKLGDRARGARKWLAYVDKLVLLPPLLKDATRDADIVHICDHSNAVYIPKKRRVPHVVTCHDLLAVRGGLGEPTDCPASPLGRFLQKWIVRGLIRADGLACDSTATLLDATRILRGRPRPPDLLPIALKHGFKQLPESERHLRLKAIKGLDLTTPFVLHVGSSQRRKNREGLLRSFARVANKVNANLVFAGKSLEPHQRQLATDLNIANRVIETGEISNETLVALYGSALVFFFPSRFEGFGWPIIEAQACGSPVICSNRDPFPEVGGDSTLMRDVDDEEGFAADILRLARNPDQRSMLIEKGLKNVVRYRPEAMISKYVSLYERVLYDQCRS